MKRHHDQTSGNDLLPLCVGQRVHVRSQVDNTRFPATVSEKCVEPRSYIVFTPNGRRLRRNHGQLRELAARPTQGITSFAEREGYDTPSECWSVPSEASASDTASDPGVCAVSPTRRYMRTRRAPEYLRD